MFKWFRRTDQTAVDAPASASTLARGFTPDGVVVAPADALPGEAVATGALPDGLVEGFLNQLVDDGLAVEDGALHRIPWDAMYAALADPRQAGLDTALALPGLSDARPVLESRHGLTDPEFAIAIAGWRDGVGMRADWRLTGALLQRADRVALMRAEHWALVREVRAFARRDAAVRTDLAQRQAWGRIRALALAADAPLDDFLWRSVVLTPERLALELRRGEGLGDDRVIEIAPGFDGAPGDWLAQFDRAREVRDRYDIPTPEGIVQVLVTPKVRRVLEEIKRLPARRVAGARAQAFLVNPIAALGAEAAEVIDEAQFEQARLAAGLRYERFTPVIERGADGGPGRAGLLVEAADAEGPSLSETRWLDDEALSRFITVLERALGRGDQLVAWEHYEFEVLGDTPRHCDELRAVLDARQANRVLIRHDDVHDLSQYSSRVDGIGDEKPIYSPYIAKPRDEEGWFPANVQPVLIYTPPDGSSPVSVPVERKTLVELERRVEAAAAGGVPEIRIDWLPTPIPLAEAGSLVERLADALGPEGNRTTDPSGGDDPPGNSDERRRLDPKHLVLRANIEQVDHDELRREAITSVPADPALPATLRPGVRLLAHQKKGLAWLQHLYRLQHEYQVRGAVLADDMGLGKTLQLLALMAWLAEATPGLAPMLVVAPVALLENWAEEVDRFFIPGALRVLTAYGAALDGLRVPREQIDARLRDEDALVKFLRPDWLGDAQVVLTTYETLRDFEFSFAAQRWSLMVCDEAQRIKNPAALVTRAAKKQNADFKIACTGTPVENTLADLWCLFDFVQAGLLGALNEFGQRYRKPIEAETEKDPARAAELRERVEELRARIAPQILRRLKREVATDLPRKIVVEDCRRLPLSARQRVLYANAVQAFQRRDESGQVPPFRNHLGLLHYLRLVCTDPREPGQDRFVPEPCADYRTKAPKLDWLLRTLRTIEARGEKVIVFCEFREIQRLLQHYIAAEFGVRPDIINGDTAATASHAASRQKRIRAFQDSPGFGVLVLSPVAVGFGVNIQAANHVVHYTRTWNPAKEDQATDRAYRIGQKKDVHVYYPVVHADDFTTFDMKLDELLAYKRRLAEDMLNGAGDIAAGEFDLGKIAPPAGFTAQDTTVRASDLARLQWGYLEALVAVLWSRQGYVCQLTPRTRDNGVDVVAIDGARGVLLQVKASSSEGAQLGWDAIKEVVTGEAYYQRRYPSVAFTKVCVTNQAFNAQARENAQLNRVEIVDREKLGELLATYPTTMLEVEDLVAQHDLARR